METQTRKSRPWTEYREGLRSASNNATASPAGGLHDVVIVGSGYGGCVAALRYAESGHRVLLLERGAEYLPGEFPNDMADLPKHLRLPSPEGKMHMGSASGLFEWRVGQGVASLVANGLGGGSLINAGVTLRPDADVFAQPLWPAALAHDASVGGALDQAFAAATSVLAPNDWPIAATPARAKDAALGTLGRQVWGIAPQGVPLSVDPEICTQCGDCATGCNVPGAKRTLQDTYLASALDSGLVEIVTLATVYAIRQIPPDGKPGRQEPLDPNAGWELTVMATNEWDRWPTREDAAKQGATLLRTPRLVLAAGTFGTTELLQRSQSLAGKALPLSPALGTRFSANGDSLSFLADCEPKVDAVGAGRWIANGQPARTPGPTITAMLDLRNQPDTGGSLMARTAVQNGVVPGALARVFEEALSLGWAGKQTGVWRWREPRDTQAGKLDPLSANKSLADRTQVLLTMGQDQAPGRLVRLDSRDETVPYWVTPNENPAYQAQQRLFGQIPRSMGEHLVPPTWRLLGTDYSALPNPPPTVTTVHPLGGCPMGDSFDTGVVDDCGWLRLSNGRVSETLQVLDASIIPTSLGINPLLTIAALAERAMAKVHERQPASPPAPAVTNPAYTPQALVQEETTATPTAVRLSETLTATSVVLPKGWTEQLNSVLAKPTPTQSLVATQPVDIKLKLDLDADDLNRVMTEASHRFSVTSGTLEFGDPSSDNASKWRVTGTGSFTALPATSATGVAGAWATLVRVGRFVSIAPITVIAFQLERWWVKSKRQAGAKTDWLSIPGVVISGLKLLWHATDDRTMHYDVSFVAAAPNAPVDGTAALGRIRLVGQKRVRYAATWGACGRWLWARAVRWVKRGSKLPLPRLERPSFWTQITALDASFQLEGRADSLDVRFNMDFADMIKGGLFSGAPAQLASIVDLPNGLQTIAGYPSLFMRYALKTRILDLRSNDYDHRPVDDSATPEQVKLRTDTGDLAPELIEFLVERGVASVDDEHANSQEKLTLKLWRYRQRSAGGVTTLPEVTPDKWYAHRVRKVKSILLVHAFAQSGYTYTLKSLPTNLAEHLYSEGWEVWVLDSRMSTRLGYERSSITIDQMIFHDIPAAVDQIITVLTGELDQPSPSDNHPLQIHCFAQCIGAASVMGSMLAGQLHYPQFTTSAFVPASNLASDWKDGDWKQAQEHQQAWMPKLASLVISQTHPFLVASRLTQAKTWVPSAVRSAFRRYSVPFATRSVEASPVEQVMDMLFATLDVPDDEHCPEEGDYRRYESACITCRRIRFIEAPLYKHRNLSAETHAELPLLFGDANADLFAQAARMVSYERLVNEDGFNIYASVARMRRFAALPIAFFHGLDNELFDAEGAQRSAKRHYFAHSQWATKAAAALPTNTARVMDLGEAPSSYSYWWLKDYAHLDPLIGKNAHTDVFTPLQAWFAAQQSVPTAVSASTVAPYSLARAPMCGPFIGDVQEAGDDVLVRVSFRVEDTHPYSDTDYVDAAGGGGYIVSKAGTRVWPVALVADRYSFVLDTELYPTSTPLYVFMQRFVPAAAGVPQTVGPGEAMLVMASGQLRLPKELWATQNDVTIQCFTIQEVLCEDNLVATGFLSLSSADATALTSAIPRGGVSNRRSNLTKFVCSHSNALVANFGARKPGKRKSVSARRQRAPTPELISAKLSKSAWVNASKDSLNFLATCCRYPGYGFDAESVTKASKLPHGANDSAAFSLMVGDQTYADSTGGLVDPLSPIEAYIDKHQRAFGREGGLGDWLASMPTYMTPDDHEFIDNYPNGRPMTRRSQRGQLEQADGQGGTIGGEPDYNRSAALTAVDAFQLIQQPRSATGNSRSYAFDHGPARFMVLDTRTQREDPWLLSGVARREYPRLLSKEDWRSLLCWLRHPDALTKLNLIACGTVVLPGLVNDCNPAYGGPVDTWQAYSRERRLLMRALTRLAQKGGRFLLVSGDYHVSAAAEIQASLSQDHSVKTIGAAIVVPPLYAPMPFVNAAPSDVWFNEPLPISSRASWQLKPTGNTMIGSGVAGLSISRSGSAYRVTVDAELTQWEHGTKRRWTFSTQL